MYASAPSSDHSHASVNLRREDGAASNLLRAASVDLPVLFQEFRTSPDGLANTEARLRLGQYGPNLLPTTEREIAVKAGRTVLITLPTRSLERVR